MKIYTGLGKAEKKVAKISDQVDITLWISNFSIIQYEFEEEY